MMMRPALFLGLVLLAAPAAQAQIDIRINVPLPTVTFTAPPPLVVVQPGVQVVEDYPEEVFYVDNWYWVRRDSRWFRTRDYHGGWVVVSDARRVPTRLVGLPPGHYKHYKVKKAEKVKYVRESEGGRGGGRGDAPGFGRGNGNGNGHGNGNGNGHGNGHGKGHGRH